MTKSVTGTEFVAKVIKRKARNPQELEEVICEVAISKLCAMFGIGPDVETSIPFDLIVYEDAMQFHLEECENIIGKLKKSGNKINIEVERLEENILDGLRVLHSLHIAHKDIKPDNMLWSNRLGKYILCDFGVAEYVKENIG